MDGCKSNTSNFSRLKVFYERLYMSCAELQNRRLQVRFLSHLPCSPEFMVVAALWPQHVVYVTILV